MLINLSNHTYESWSSKQQKVAIASYGRVEEIPFPTIPPEWDMPQVTAAASNMLDRIIAEYEIDNLVILIAGEQSFIIDFVRLASIKNIACVVATSERIVTQLEDGTKKVKFDFVKFRKVSWT